MSFKKLPYILILLLAGCLQGNDFEPESFNLPEHSTLEALEKFQISSPAEGAFFSHIRKIHVLSDKNLVVQNYPDHQLYELTPKGELVGVIGRQGRGPGEFIQTYISHLAPNDSLHVFDFNNSRHQVLTRGDSGRWHYARESGFRRMAAEGLEQQIPDRVVHNTVGAPVGLFRIHPTARDTLQGQYVYVSEVDLNMEHAGDVSRLRLASDLAIHRGENNSMTIHNNHRFYRSFYTYRADTDEVLLIQNTSNEIVSVDSSGKETVKGYLPYERFPKDRSKLNESLENVNYSYAGMEEIVRDKLLDHEPYYWNVILHENRLWVNLARSDSDSPNWIITDMEGEILESFHGPEEISEVTIYENRMYGSVRDSDGAVYLVGYVMTEK